MCVALLAWIAISAIDLLASSEYFMFAYPAKVMFSIIVSYCCFWFFLNFTESILVKSRFVILALIILPALDILALLTSPWHLLYFTCYDSIASSANPSLPRGPLFWVRISILVICVFITYGILFRYIIKNFWRYPLLAFIGFGALIPLLLNLAFTFGFPYDLSAIGFFFTIIIFVYFSSASKGYNPFTYKETLTRITTSGVLFEDNITNAALMISKEGSIALDASRVGIWRFSNDYNTLENIICYDKKSEKTIIRSNCDLSNCDGYPDNLLGKRQFVVSDIRQDNEFSPAADIFNSQMCAFIDSPIHIDGKLYGIVCIEQHCTEIFPRKREWTIEEQDFAASLSDFMTIAIENTERRTLLRTLEERADELETAYKEIERLSMIDKLTSIPNRRCFDDRLESEWSMATRLKTNLSVLMIDIDHFKIYNDTYHHQQGDTALHAVAQTLSQICTRASDFIARWGGEEFIALLPGTPLQGALKIAEKARKAVESMVIPCRDGTETKVTISIGVKTMTPKVNSSRDNFISDADKALYNAKKAGRNRVVHCEAP